MHKVEPTVYLIASTSVDQTQLSAYLDHVGASSWESDAESDVEEIVEVMARSCYKSFGPGLNPNVTRTRRRSKDHLANIIRVGHGSVLEHAWASFMICDVSRVFTHELVRHRAGVAISQESLRFVRLEDMGLWIPSAFSNNPEAVAVFERTWSFLEQQYEELLNIAAEIEGVPFHELPFSNKKKYTSAARRVAPIGLATNIGWSCNVRALRHIIEMRTDPGAEEEIRLVFSKIAAIAIQEWPNLFQDYQMEEVDGVLWYKTDSPKV